MNITTPFIATLSTAAQSRRSAITRVAGLAIATFMLAAAACPASAAGPNDGQKQKLVIQVSDGDAAKWNLALNNARNVQEELGANNVEIEIVAYGPGIGMLKMDATTNSRIAEMAKAGVQIVACENTMRNQKLAKADMHPDISYAPSGVTEIMRRQREGWSYLRP
jgi:intracellular sulfur oxidation DsrE/DsrF family protein